MSKDQLKRLKLDNAALTVCNKRQEKTIDRQNVTIAAKDKQIRRQARVLGSLLSPKVQPQTTDEWAAMVAQAKAEIEAEQ